MTTMLNELRRLDATFTKLQQDYESAGFECTRVPFSEKEPQSSLKILFHHEGEHELVFPLALMLVPITEDAGDQVAFGLQTFAVLHPQIDSIYLSEVMMILNDINLRLPFGAFGVNRNDRRIFFKQSVPIGLTKMPSEAEFFQFVDRQAGALLGEMKMFIDSILDVAFGTTSADEAAMRLSF